MSAEVRKEVICRQRQAELQRVLLPDAPPKRQTRRPSPDREACPLVEKPESPTAADEALPVTENEPAPEPGPELDLEPEVEAIIDYENIDVTILGEEVEVETQPIISHGSSTNITGKKFESILDNWLQDDDSDVDLDLNFDNNDDSFFRSCVTQRLNQHVTLT